MEINDRVTAVNLTIYVIRTILKAYFQHNRILEWKINKYKKLTLETFSLRY